MDRTVDSGLVLIDPQNPSLPASEMIFASWYSCLYVLSSHIEAWLVYVACRRWQGWLPRLGHRGQWSFHPVLLDLSLWTKPIIMSWRHKGTLRKAPLEDELVQEPAWACQSCEPPWKWILQDRSNLQMTSAPAIIWINLMGHPDPELPSWTSPELLIHRNKKSNCIVLRH